MSLVTASTIGGGAAVLSFDVVNNVIVGIQFENNTDNPAHVALTQPNNTVMTVDGLGRGVHTRSLRKNQQIPFNDANGWGSAVVMDYP